MRYQHASEIRTDLQRLKRDTETGKTSAIKTVETLPTRAWWLRKAAISGAVVGIIAVLVAVAVVYSTSHTNKSIGIDSVAVLPLVSNSSDAKTQILSDGIIDSLIDSLS